MSSPSTCNNYMFFYRIVWLQVKAVFDHLAITNLLWSGNSPDKNPIQNIWRLSLQVNRAQPNNERVVKEAVIHSWNQQVTPAVIHGLIESIPGLIGAVIKAKGDRN